MPAGKNSTGKRGRPARTKKIPARFTPEVAPAKRQRTNASTQSCPVDVTTDNRSPSTMSTTHTPRTVSIETAIDVNLLSPTSAVSHAASDQPASTCTKPTTDKPASNDPPIAAHPTDNVQSATAQSANKPTTTQPASNVSTRISTTPTSSSTVPASTYTTIRPALPPIYANADTAQQSVQRRTTSRQPQSTGHVPASIHVHALR
uniref:Mucin-5AC-like n=1 Tax=Saccoglossus kowalevskii TaxID=10224 RepID=A0ABM0MTK5_SACKO|nr:PREDICTED: mucin-5AC-like [Saccoglossus kowalevskii]